MHQYGGFDGVSVAYLSLPDSGKDSEVDNRLFFLGIFILLVLSRKFLPTVGLGVFRFSGVNEGCRRPASLLDRGYCPMHLCPTLECVRLTKFPISVLWRHYHGQLRANAETFICVFTF